MARSIKRRRSGQFKKQRENLEKARQARAQGRTADPVGDELSNDAQRIKEFKAAESYYKKQLELEKKKYWNERRRVYRLENKGRKYQLEISELERETDQMRRDIEEKTREIQEIQEIQEWSERAAHSLLEEIDETQDSIDELQAEHRKLKKRYRGLTRVVESLDAQQKERSKTYRLVNKDVYTCRARKLARYLVSIGAAEKKVGAAIKEITEAFGIEEESGISEGTILAGDVVEDIHLTGRPA